MPMIKKLIIRTITAFFFVIAVIYSINYSNFSAAIFCGVIGILSLFEYNQMNSKRPMFVSYIGAALIWYLTIEKGADQKVYQLLIPLSLGFSIYAIVALFKTSLLELHNRMPSALAFIYFGISMALAMDLLMNVDTFSNKHLLGIICLIWSSDTMAYLTGSVIGKTKLIPHISPNKTWEGTLGAGFFSMLAGYLFFLYSDLETMKYWILLGLIVWIVGSLGDLVESSLKRFYNVKDSGNILPGHGGMFDRFDSFLFVWPFVYLFHYLISGI